MLPSKTGSAAFQSPGVERSAIQGAAAFSFSRLGISADLQPWFQM
jgi:hypothetical protein